MSQRGRRAGGRDDVYDFVIRDFINPMVMDRFYVFCCVDLKKNLFRRRFVSRYCFFSLLFYNVFLVFCLFVLFYLTLIDF